MTACPERCPELDFGEPLGLNSGRRLSRAVKGRSRRAPPRAPGTYVLFLHLGDDVELDVGRLGRVAFPAGHYAYVGSARGPGGLAARLARHARPDKPCHWHIDHLTAVARVTEAWWMVGDTRRECAWAAALTAWSGAQVVAPGFGASDCRCRAHLLRLVVQPSRAVIGAVQQMFE